MTYDSGVRTGHQCKIGENVRFGRNVIIEDRVSIGDHSVIDHNAIIRENTKIGKHAYIGANCIIGENQITANGFQEKRNDLIIGNYALIRSGSIIYGESIIGDYFQTGHQVTIREKTQIGSNVSIGTLSDIQGHCSIGNYVRAHSNVHIGQKTLIDDYVWIYPYVVFTNDPTPPSEELLGVHVHSFAIVATGAIILPGLNLAEDCLVAAGAIVTKNVNAFEVVAGNPAKVISDVRKIQNRTTGKTAYPWRYHFERNMPWEGKGYEAFLQG